MILGQSHAEDILREHLARFGVHVELNTELEDFEQGTEGVTAHLIKRDGEREIKEVIKVEYLVGAEGAKSAYTSSVSLGGRKLGECD